MNLSIIIPTKDRGDVFNETLNNLLEASGKLDAEIIVVNDSVKGSPAIPPTGRKVLLLQNQGRGVAAARNLGAKSASTDNLLFMDDDFLVRPEHLSNVMKQLGQDSRRIVLFNWVYPPELRDRLRDNRFGRYLERFRLTSLQGWLNDEWHDDGIFELRGGASYFLPIRKQTFETIGGYEEKFTHAGAEDYDFVSRARKAGVRFFLDPKQLLYHNEKDRTNPEGFLERKRRNAETIAIAAALGYRELAVHYPAWKYGLLKCLSICKPLIAWVANQLPEHQRWDRFYFRLMNILLAVYFFDGYTKLQK